MDQEQFTARTLNNSLIHQVGDDLVIYDGEQTRCHVLNPAAAAVWECCGTSANIDELTAAVSSAANLPADPEFAYLALEELKNADLLSGEPLIPAKTGGLSRRQVLMGLGVAAVMLPAVKSVVAPTTVMAASGGVPPCNEEVEECSF
jgi:hypothetical protein